MIGRILVCIFLCFSAEKRRALLAPNHAFLVPTLGAFRIMRVGSSRLKIAARTADETPDGGQKEDEENASNLEGAHCTSRSKRFPSTGEAACCLFVFPP